LLEGGCPGLIWPSHPTILEVEHSFISLIECHLLDRSDNVGKVIAPVQKDTLD